MSSATSINGTDAESLSRPEAKAPVRDTLRPWHFFLLASLIAATAAVVLARQGRPEHLILISLTIGAAGFAGAALYRTLLPLTGRDEALRTERLSESMRAVLEREKLLVLRSIKELEFDRAMGKLSAKDFDEMSARLRARALSLIRQLDAGTGYRELIERDLKMRLASAPAVAPGGEPKPESADVPVPAVSVPAACACGAANDPDAAFCKRCGSRLATDGAA